MPTYHNLTDNDVTVDNILFHGGETRETDRILSSNDLTLVSEEPFFNPVIADTIVVAASGSTYTLNMSASSYAIEITGIEGTANVYFNNVLNTPPLLVRTGSSVVFKNKGRVEALYILYTDAHPGQCQVRELREPQITAAR